MNAWVRRAALAAALALAAWTQPGCSTNPATGERLLLFLSKEDEIRLGAEAAPEFAAEFGGAVKSESLQRYVTDIGMRMARETEGEFPSYPWEFTLLDSDVVNAFALPGGKVFITRGLAERLTNEAQMAGVLGHEIGHVTAQHGSRRITQQVGANIAVAAAAVIVSTSDDATVQRVGAVGIPALQIGGQVVLLKYGREQEIQSDRLGVRYMTAVGYDPLGQVQVMRTLAALSEGPRPPEFLSTHPHPESRIEALESLVAGDYAYTQGNENYRLKEAEYRRGFLEPSSRLPRPPEGRAGLAMAWCAHCAGD